MKKFRLAVVSGLAIAGLGLAVPAHAVPLDDGPNVLELLCGTKVGMTHVTLVDDTAVIPLIRGGGRSC